MLGLGLYRLSRSFLEGWGGARNAKCPGCRSGPWLWPSSELGTPLLYHGAFKGVPEESFTKGLLSEHGKNYRN